MVIGVLALGNRHALNRQLARLNVRRRMLLGAISVAAVLPLIHVVIETAMISHQQTESVIGAGESLTDRVRHVATGLETMPIVLETPIGWFLLLVVGSDTILRLWRRKPDWVQIALLAGALLGLAWSTQVGLTLVVTTFRSSRFSQLRSLD